MYITPNIAVAAEADFALAEHKDRDSDYRVDAGLRLMKTGKRTIIVGANAYIGDKMQPNLPTHYGVPPE